jgi:lipopolysaccharide export system permease protein
MEFERYGVLVSRQSQGATGDISTRSLSTRALLKDRNSFNMGELLWRIALPFMCLLLMLVAIPLSFVNPRAGRSANLMIALFLFVVYSNMISIFQAAVVQQKLSLAVAWWPLHLLGLIMIAAMFSWRLKINSRYHPLVVWGSMKRARVARRMAS